MATRHELVQCVLAGIENGQEQYESMSGGDWAWAGSEYWLTVHVALGLRALVGDGRVTVEGAGKVAMEAAGRNRGRPRLVIQSNMRFDIVLWHRNTAARAPIEIKSQKNDKNLIIKDVSRVIAALKGSQMKFGIVGYYFSRTGGVRGNAIERVESYAADIEERCRKIREKNIRISPRCGEIHGDAGDAWFAGCLLIEKRPAR